MGVIPQVSATLVFRHSLFTDIKFIKQAGLAPQNLWDLPAFAFLVLGNRLLSLLALTWVLWNQIQILMILTALY